jgi:benzoyl-CoA reductase/2-hydroxyglutaryl-CoA dehydratase subunit BcrC/BadD/HgdB
VQAAREGGAPRLTGVEALTVFGATVALPFDSSPQLIDLLLAERTQPMTIAPCVYSGSATASPEAYAAIERRGTVVAADDQDAGTRGLWPEVAEAGDPRDALARAALNRPPPPARTSTAERAAYLVDLVRRTRAETVVFAIEPFDHPPAWELPTLEAALKAEGVGVKVLETADV